MFASFRAICRPRSAFHFSALATALFAAAFALPRPALAQGTHLWTQSQLEDFEKGTPLGVALTSDGRLLEGPGLTQILTTPSTFVWSVAADKNGVAYLGTGSPATVLRVGRDGKPFTLFEAKDLSVQVVRLGPDGYLYAATLPSGKVYRLKPDATTTQDDATATVVFDLAKVAGADAGGNTGAKSRYIWDMTFDSQGRLYIATGDPGAVYRVDPTKIGSGPGAKPGLFFKSDEAHIRSLAWDAKGDLIAGSDGSGLVYRIDPQGKGYVLFEAPRREITALAVGPDGTIYAACVGDKSQHPLPPLPVQGTASVTITVVQPQSFQAVNASASIPEGTEIYALGSGQAPRLLWSDKEAIVYALAERPDGLLALTGNLGRIFRIHPDGSYADVAHLDAQQGLSLAVVQDAEGMGGVLVGTGNTGKLVLLGAGKTHEYASDVLDAGTLAQFGRVEVEPGSNGYQIFTRTGNVEQPVRGWTDWQPLKDGVVASPPGRFLQWKAVFQSGAPESGGSGSRGSVGSVGVNYLPVNSAPVVDDLVVVPGARLNPQSTSGSDSQTVNISFSPDQSSSDDNGSSSTLQANKDRTAVTVRWAAHDDDGDKLIYSLYIRGDGEAVWRLLKDRITDQAYSFDATMLPDGGYQIKVVASDAPSHTPGDALAGDKISGRFVIDTTAPAITGFKAAGEPVDCSRPSCPKPFLITFDAVDATSPIARAGYSLDLGPWQYIEPVGKISDSKTEHYSFRIWLNVEDGRIAEHLITVRAFDRYDNVGVAKTIIPAQEK
jgi:hypothetical protein